MFTFKPRTFIPTGFLHSIKGLWSVIHGSLEGLFSTKKLLFLSSAPLLCRKLRIFYPLEEKIGFYSTFYTGERRYFHLRLPSFTNLYCLIEKIGKNGFWKFCAIKGTGWTGTEKLSPGFFLLFQIVLTTLSIIGNFGNSMYSELEIFHSQNIKILIIYFYLKKF